MGFIDFTGKTAVVTGAARGIPQAIALKLAEYGANIFGGDILDMSETVAKCEALGVKAGAVHTDISDRAAMQNLLDSAVKMFGKVDIWVNGAGIMPFGSLLDITEKEWQRVQSINIAGPLWGTQLAMQHMIENQDGVIINISSICDINISTVVPYDMTKAAVSMLSKGAAAACGKYNVRVNTVCPGRLKTDIFGDRFKALEEKGISIDEIYWNPTKKKIPLHRIQEVEDIANAVAFLASDAAKNITGDSLYVCGGEQLLRAKDE